MYSCSSSSARRGESTPARLISSPRSPSRASWVSAHLWWFRRRSLKRETFRRRFCLLLVFAEYWASAVGIRDAGHVVSVFQTSFWVAIVILSWWNNDSEWFQITIKYLFIVVTVHSYRNITSYKRIQLNDRNGIEWEILVVCVDIQL